MSDEDFEKVYWFLGFCAIFAPLIFSQYTWTHSVFVGLLAIYCIYLGAYFRGKNWFSGFSKVKEVNE